MPESNYFLFTLAGTSITSQSLNVEEAESKTGARIEVVKAFTISGGEYKSERNLLKLVPPAASKADFSLILIETGTNEIRYRIQESSQIF